MAIVIELHENARARKWKNADLHPCLRVCSVSHPDYVESIINSFDCARRKESLPPRRKAEVQAEQRRTPGNWRAGDCSESHQVLTWPPSLYVLCCGSLTAAFTWHCSNDPILFSFSFPCGTDSIWLIMSKQEIEARRIRDMEINLIWFGFVHFYTPTGLSTHVNMHSCSRDCFSPHQRNGDISLHLTPRVFWQQKYFGKKWLRLLFSSCLCQCK